MTCLQVDLDPTQLYSIENKCGLRRFKEAYAISQHKYENLMSMGETLQDLLKKVNELYRKAILANDRLFLSFWETGFLRNNAIRKTHRRFFLNNAYMLPHIIRIETTDCKHIIEYHAGWKGTELLRNVEKLKEYYASYPHHTAYYYEGWETFQGLKILLESIFGAIHVKKGLELFKQDYIDPALVIQRSPHVLFQGWLPQITARWNPLMQRVCYNGLYALYQRFSKGEIIIDPPPNMLLESKILPAIMNHERYGDLFTEKERTLFPQTSLITKALQIKHEKGILSLDTIATLPKSARRYIIKYAGANMKRNFGGKNVFLLSAYSKKGARDLLHYALKDWQLYKEPWIIQENVSHKEIMSWKGEDATRYTQPLYRLLRSYFLNDEKKKQIKHIGSLLFLRSFFKVHACSDSIYAKVKIPNDATN